MTAVVLGLVGLGGGVFGWQYFAGAPERPLAAATAPAPVPVQEEAAFVPADQPVAPRELPATSPTAPTPPKSPKSPNRPAVAPVAVAARQAAPDARPKYVGGLSIDSEPGGEVFLNRESAGRTPLRLDNLRAGSHLVWVESTGYRRWTRVVQVPADRVTRLFAELEPISAR